MTQPKAIACLLPLMLLSACALHEPPAELAREASGVSEAPLDVALPVPIQAAGDAWCVSCEDAGDCPDGWLCSPGGGNPDVRWCGPPCEDDTDCREDYTCLIGACRPRISHGCVPDAPNEVWDVDACGGAVQPDLACGGGTLCSNGVCRAGRPGDTCDDAEIIEPVTQVIWGDLNNYLNDTRGSCAGNGPERVYRFDLDEPTPFEAWVTGNGNLVDAVLYLRRGGCEGEEVLCDDDSHGGTDPFIQGELQPGTWYLFVDAYGGRPQDFRLVVDFSGGCLLDPCVVGERRCAAEDEPQVCQRGLDGCVDWRSAERCVGDAVCRGGFCQVACPPAPCAAGAVRCTDEGGVEACALGGDGCLDWRLREICAADERCVEGLCQGICPDASCALGQTRCQGELIQTCALSDDGCVRWEAPALCGGGAICVGAACADPCPDAPCDLGQRRCFGDQVLRCLPDATGCPDWQGEALCVDGERCIAGQCVPVNVCPPDSCEVGESRCLGDGLLEFCGLDDQGCADWVVQRGCPEGTACDEDAGVCAPVDVCPDAPCAQGEAACQGDTVLACALDDQGCWGWTSFGACPDGRLCSEGRCVAPAPSNTCAGAQIIAPRDQTLQASLDRHLDTEASPCPGGDGRRDIFYTFTVDQRVALTLTPVRGEVITLFSGRRCVEEAFAGCAPQVPFRVELSPGTYVLMVEGVEDIEVRLRFELACEDECEGPARRCIRDDALERCVAGPEGCFVRELSRCPEGTLCEGDGICVAEEDGGVLDGGVSDGGAADGGVADGGVTDGGVADGGGAPDGATRGDGGVDGGLGRTDGGLSGFGEGGRPTMRGGRGCQSAPGSSPWGGLWLIGGLLWGIRRRRQR